MRVLKYPIAQPGSSINVHLPVGATFVHFADQPYSSQSLQAWFLVDEDEPETEYRTFRVVATGESFDGEWLATTIIDYFVWHLVEETS